MELNNIQQQDLTLIESNDIQNQTDEIMVESHPTPPVVALLSFGNILEQFPEFLIHVLPYIPDRTIWNSIASCNQDMYEKSKASLPPWPTNYKLNVPAVYGPEEKDSRYHRDNRLFRPTWSPDGTQIAGSTKGKIIIFDQRRGRLRFRHHNGHNNNNSNINDVGWIAHMNEFRPETCLLYSPDGSFLVSATTRLDGTVKIWKYSTDGNYELLREWNAPTDWIGRFDTDHHIDISPCSRYIVVIVDRNKILLKDIKNLRETIKSIVLDSCHVHNVMFCKNDDQCSIFINVYNIQTKEEDIKIWRPYDSIDDDQKWRPDDYIFDDEREYYDPNDYLDNRASLITVLEPQLQKRTVAFSHDSSMIVYRMEGKLVEDDDDDEYFYSKRAMLYSIDNVTKSATFKQSIPAPCNWNPIYLNFTPDDKCIVYRNKNGLLVFWNIKTEREITDQMKTTYNVNHTCGQIYISPVPAGTIRRFLVRDKTDECFCIASYWEK